MAINISVAFWICVSICSSTTLVLLLKQVGKRVHCKHTTTLSTFHILATWGFLTILSLLGKVKKTNAVPFWRRVRLASLVVGSIVLMNFNLGANSIGFYQMSKLACIPYTVIHKMIFKHQKFTAFELISLTVLLIGVALFSVSDIEVNFKGTIYAVAAVLCTVFNQMSTEDYQKEYDIVGTQLQLSVAPPEFGVGCIASALIEATGENGFLNARLSIKDILLMLLTCVFAIGVNLSTFSLIGKTSSITYQVVGHFKTVLLLVIGYILFPSKWESKFQMYKAYTGIVIALIGVFMYTKAKMAPKKQQDETQPLINSEQKK